MDNSKPCPNCGHCPTCGHTPYQTLPYIPVYPIYAIYPTVPVDPWVQPWITWGTCTGEILGNNDNYQLQTGGELTC